MGLYKELPLEKNNYPIALIPAKISNHSQSVVATTSSVMTLSANTTVLNVMVVGNSGTGSAGALGKWGSSSVNTASFDFMINAGQNLTFAVPVSVFGAPLASVAGANAANGLYNTVSFIQVGAASIFTAEY